LTRKKNLNHSSRSKISLLQKREKEKQRGRERERGKERDREGEREKEKEREREREKERDSTCKEDLCLKSINDLKLCADRYVKS
jgi:hypothetical protein